MKVDTRHEGIILQHYVLFIADLEQKFLIRNLTMASSSSPSGRVPVRTDVPSNLANAMRKVDSSKCDVDYVSKYVKQHGETTVDEGDEEGRTPLMIACVMGNKEVVEYLLQLGTDVNAASKQLRNTPLHYLCEGRAGLNMAEKVAIAELLFNHGTVYKANSLGLTPICYAGWHQMRELVNLFAGEMVSRVGGIMTNEKVKGMEFLAVSYAIQKSSSFRFKSVVYSCMLEAKQLPVRVHSPCNSEKSEVEKLFKRSECSTVEELECLRGNSDAIQIEGFLVGARIIPDELKPEYCYWNNLLEFGNSTKDFSQTCSIISFFLRAGNMTAKLPLFDILSSFYESIWRRNDISQTFSDINDVMTLCFDRLSSTWSIEGDREIIDDAIVEILINAALCSHGEHCEFESLTTTVIRILKLFNNDEPCTKQERLTFFPAWAMINILPEKIGEGKPGRSDDPCGMLDEGEIRRIKHAFPQLLYLNDASDKSYEHETVLHCAVNFVNYLDDYTDEVLELVLFIIRSTIRHGCPLDALNYMGITAKAFALMCITDHNNAYGTEDDGLDGLTGFEKNDPRIVAFLDAFSGPSSVLPLEELAARVVLKWKIPYRDYLPEKLHEIVSGF